MRDRIDSHPISVSSLTLRLGDGRSRGDEIIGGGQRRCRPLMPRIVAESMEPGASLEKWAAVRAFAPIRLAPEGPRCSRPARPARQKGDRSTTSAPGGSGPRSRRSCPQCRDLL